MDDDLLNFWPVIARAQPVPGRTEANCYKSENVDDHADKISECVVTVCAGAKGRRPIFPARTRLIHRTFEEDPKPAAGAHSEEGKLTRYRRVRDEFKAFIETLPQARAE
jgi:arsenate reductase